MLADIAHQRSQSLLRQRKALLAAVALSFVVNVALGVAVTSKDREVILQPVAPRALQISASGVSADYLEFVTRDTALMLLNRTPDRQDHAGGRPVRQRDASGHSDRLRHSGCRRTSGPHFPPHPAKGRQ